MSREVTLAELAAEVGGTLIGDGSRRVTGVATLDAAGPTQISFFSNKKYKAQFLATKAGAAIVGKAEAEGEKPEGVALLVVDQPYLAFAKVSTRFHQQPTYPVGVHERASVDPSAELGANVTVLPFAYVGPRVKIGAGSIIHAGCAILEGASIGSGCVLYPGVVVREGCILGDRTIVQPGAVIGADGFGFAFDPKNMRHFKVPQSGRVQVQPDVEIGANTCIDRGTLGDTVIGFGTKIDDLVMIGHNVEVGPLSLFAGQAGIAGSTKIGAGVMLGGQAGVVGHIHVADQVKVTATSVVMGDVDEAGLAIGGTPAHDQKRWLREQAAVQHLPELLKEVRALRKRVEELEKGKA